MIRRTKTAYSADVPDLLGGIATGKTLTSTRKRMTRAMEYHLEMMQQNGEKIPAPRQCVQFEIDPSSDEEFCTWVEVRIPHPVG